jgi:hypothetical protein
LTARPKSLFLFSFKAGREVISDTLKVRERRAYYQLVTPRMLDYSTWVILWFAGL